MAQMKKSTMLLWVLVVAAVLGVVKFLFFKSADRATTERSTTTPAKQEAVFKASDVLPMERQPSQETASPKSVEGKKVSTVIQYANPAGGDKVGFTLVVDQDGVIVDAETAVLGQSQISQTRQQSFASAFLTAVKGKKLRDLTAIDRVGGSSLTTGAFNASLDMLKSQL